MLVCACSGKPEATVKCLEDGQLNLEKLMFSAWQLISIPRQWDDPQKSDPMPEKTLADFVQRIAKAMTVWQDNLVHLSEIKKY